MRRFFALTLLVIANAASAFTIQPVDGLWGIVDEQSLAIGRAFNFEMTGNLGVVTMYNYNAARAPTFYTGAGVLSSTNSLTVTLNEPTGGTCLGCSPSSGALLSTPGQAVFEFTSSVTGYVTLPREGRKAIVKGAIGWPQSPSGIYGIWILNLVSSTSTLVSSYALQFNRTLAGTTSGDGIAVDTSGLWGCEYQARGSAAGYTLCVKIFSTGSGDRSIVARWWGNRMDGIWQYTGLSSTALYTAMRVTSGNGDQVGLKALAEAVEPVTDDRAAAFRREIAALRERVAAGDAER